MIETCTAGHDLRLGASKGVDCRDPLCYTLLGTSLHISWLARRLAAAVFKAAMAAVSVMFNTEMLVQSLRVPQSLRVLSTACTKL